MALTEDGSIYTWGKKDYLGQGKTQTFTENQTVPQRLRDFDQQIQQIGTGGDTMFVIKKNGILLSW